MKRTAVLMLALSLVAWAAGDAVAPLARRGLKPQTPSFEADAIAIPRMLSYQGKLTDTMGVPVRDTVWPTRFRLYTQPTGGSHIWQENRNVPTGEGLFSVVLGSSTPIPSVPDAGNLYLGMTVGADPEMAPRVRIVSAAYAFLAEDARHADTADYAVAGGILDSVPGDFAIGGDLRGYGKCRLGYQTQNSGELAFVAGWRCTASGLRSVVSGGSGNTATEQYTTIAGGVDNQASGPASTVGGGHYNAAAGRDATVAGGSGSTADGDWSTVGGGGNNTVQEYGSTISGGTENDALDSLAVVSGGYYNTAYSRYATVGGGLRNRADSAFSTICGGDSNLAPGRYAAIGGGHKNEASDVYSSVGGGWNNTADSTCATVAGGYHNLAGQEYATVGGGYENQVNGRFGTVGGGSSNEAGDGYATVSGGTGNTAGPWATVGGGVSNDATGDYASVGGGYYNRSPGEFSAIGGGYRNHVGGEYSCVAGGYADSVSTDFSVAAGRKVKVGASAHYTFAFGDSFVTTTPRAVVFHHSGQTTKLGVGVANPSYQIECSGGAYCDGTDWVNGSARKLKDNISPLTPDEMGALLDELGRTEVVRYTRKSEEGGEEHIGLIAEDAPEVVATPARDGINTADAIGWLVAIAKAQQAEIDALKAKLAGK